MTDNISMLKLKNLSKSFYDNSVLDNINLEIEMGKFTTLLGKNGCGKSTLLKIMSGFELPCSGSVQYKEHDLSEINFPYVKDIFFIHENIDYNFPYNMETYISLMKDSISNWDQEFFDKMLDERQITLDRNYNEYSRGQKMQIVLMIGLASNVPVLLLDEITSVIDVYGRKYFLDLLDQYVKKGNTVVITTNIINELEFYTDNLIIIKDSHIVLNESVKNIPHNFSKIRKKRNIEHPVFSDNNCVWAGINSDRSVSYIIPTKNLKEYKDISEIKDKRESTLEDIFIYYFSNNEDDYENIA